jgi:hypothetical protein
MTKKAIGLFLALGMAASLVACGGTTTTPTESPAASPSPTTSP